MKSIENRGEKFRKQMYGGLLKKNLKNMIIRELIERFGYSDKIAIAELMADTFIELISLTCVFCSHRVCRLVSSLIGSRLETLVLLR